MLTFSQDFAILTLKNFEEPFSPPYFVPLPILTQRLLVSKILINLYDRLKDRSFTQKGCRVGLVGYPDPVETRSDDFEDYAALDKDIDKNILNQIFGGGGRKVTAVGKVHCYSPECFAC